MNIFELNIEKRRRELDSELIRIDKSILGRQADYNRRIGRIMSEYYERRNSLDTERMGIIKRINSSSDEKERCLLSAILEDNGRAIRYHKDKMRARVMEEKSEMASCIGELRIRKRQIRQDFLMRIEDIKERYIDWIQDRKIENESSKRSK